MIVGLAYLAFTYFVPIRSQPRLADRGAQLLPVIQGSAEVLLSLVPGPASGRDCHDRQSRATDAHAAT